MAKRRKKKVEKQTAAEIKEEKTFHGELIAQMLTLSTSGFGLVAALAWNTAIQAFFKEYVEPKIPGSGLTYQFLYALFVTLLIVIITYQLSRISARFQVKK